MYDKIFCMLPLTPLSTLRILVAYLGESSATPWWPTQFLTEAGLDFFRGVFPKTSVSAAVNGTVRAAQEVHDERIGRIGVRHLFRFDGGLERDLHREILHAPSDAIMALVANRETALERLKNLLLQTVSAAPGPVQIGRFGQETSPDAVSDMAAHYYDGFTNDRLIYPYFAEVRR
ncbi:MAG: BrxE family protein [Alkalispirochaeta sp.]